MYVFVFYNQWFEVKGSCLYCWYRWKFADDHSLNFLFIIHPFLILCILPNSDQVQWFSEYFIQRVLHFVVIADTTKSASPNLNNYNHVGSIQIIEVYCLLAWRNSEQTGSTPYILMTITSVWLERHMCGIEDSNEINNCENRIWCMFYYYLILFTADPDYNTTTITVKTYIMITTM
jgi:hypothetical protein